MAILSEIGKIFRRFIDWLLDIRLFRFFGSSGTNINNRIPVPNNDTQNTNTTNIPATNLVTPKGTNLKIEQSTTSATISRGASGSTQPITTSSNPRQSFVAQEQNRHPTHMSYNEIVEKAKREADYTLEDAVNKQIATIAFEELKKHYKDDPLYKFIFDSNTFISDFKYTKEENIGIFQLFHGKYGKYDARQIPGMYKLLNFRGISIYGDVPTALSESKGGDFIVRFDYRDSVHFFSAKRINGIVYINNSLRDHHTDYARERLLECKIDPNVIVVNENVAIQPDVNSCGSYDLYNSNQEEFFHKIGINHNNIQDLQKFQATVCDAVYGIYLAAKVNTDVWNKLQYHQWNSQKLISKAEKQLISASREFLKNCEKSKGKDIVEYYKSYADFMIEARYIYAKIFIENFEEDLKTASQPWSNFMNQTKEKIEFKNLQEYIKLYEERNKNTSISA